MKKLSSVPTSFLAVLLAFSLVLLFHGESFAPPRCGNGNLDQAWEECEVNHPCADAAETCDLVTCLCSPPPPACGDGVINQTSEQCEDGVSCADPTYTCDVATCLCSPPPPPVCGDETLNEGEECEVGIPCADPTYTCDESTCLCIPPPGDEGCTPGFWKADQHFGCWTGYIPEQSFNGVFGTDITILWSERGKPAPVEEPTLLQALQANGGGDNRLARHGVAALLNAASGGVDFPLTAAEVIAAVQAGDADTLADANELGCPLSQCSLLQVALSSDTSSSPSAMAGGCATTASVPANPKAINLALLGLVGGAVVLWKRVYPFRKM